MSMLTENLLIRTVRVPSQSLTRGTLLSLDLSQIPDHSDPIFGAVSKAAAAVARDKIF